MINVVRSNQVMEGFIFMDRKEIVRALEEHFKVKSKYLGVPSCNYQIQTEDETYTIDRAGKIINSKGEEVELEVLLNIRPKPIEFTELEVTSFEVSVPMEGHTGVTLRNLVNMIYSKQELIKKSLDINEDIIKEEFCIGINEAKIETMEDFKNVVKDVVAKYNSSISFDFENSKLTFKFFEGEVSSEKVKAYTKLVALMNESAKELKRVSTKVKETDNDKFTFRVFLIRLGMVGDEYKDIRKMLLKNLDGNSAFRNGKKPEKVSTEETE